MAALMTFRTAALRFVDRAFVPLAANAKVYPGAAAMILTAGANSGYYQQAQAGVGSGVGRFTGRGSVAPGTNGVLDNTGGANGAILAEVEHFNPFWLFWLDNDAVSAVVAADRGSNCYMKDDHTATHAQLGNGVAGIVYDLFNGNGTANDSVWVKFREMGGGAAPGTAGRIQSGTAMLVAGTLAITAADITANSLILVSMRDPGAGSLADFAALDVPVGTRVAGAAGAGGSFTVNAINGAASALINTAVCTFDWIVVN